MSMARILARLDRLERALHIDEPADKSVLVERLMAETDLVAARLRASPNYTEPTPEENATYWAEFGAFMATLA
jgi:hypothetical protein